MDRLTSRQLYDAVGERMQLRWVAGLRGEGRAIEPGDKTSRRPSQIGYLNIIYPNKVQIIGTEELAYLDSLDSRQRWETIEKIMAYRSIALLVTKDQAIPGDLRDAAEESDTPLWASPKRGHELLTYLQYHLARGLARLLKEAAPGSDHQLAFARGLITSAWAQPVIEVIQAWANGTEAPQGLAVDTDLRWQIITQLARRGVIGESDIAAELINDATASGAERAAGARAALPTPEAKAWAWHAATADPDTPNETHYQICSQFWQVGQDEVLRRYVREYTCLLYTSPSPRD